MYYLKYLKNNYLYRLGKQTYKLKLVKKKMGLYYTIFIRKSMKENLSD